MRTLLWMTVSLLVMAPASPVLAQDEAERAIRSVLADYVQGWRESDPARLAVVLDPGGSVTWTTGSGDEESVGSMTFADVLARDPRPQPEYGLEWTVQSLDVIDRKLAVAQVEISRSGGSYLDVLVLYNVAGEWRIVSKTFVTRPD